MMRLKNDDTLKGAVGLITIGLFIILIDELLTKMFWWVGLFPISIGLYFLITDIFAVDKSNTED